MRRFTVAHALRMHRVSLAKQCYAKQSKIKCFDTRVRKTSIFVAVVITGYALHAPIHVADVSLDPDLGICRFLVLCASVGSPLTARLETCRTPSKKTSI